MLHQISWAAYFQAVFIATLIYYLSVLIWFKKDIRAVLVNKASQNGFRQKKKSEPVSLQQPMTAPGEEADFQSLIDELNAFFEVSRKSKTVREEMIISLRTIVKKHRCDNAFFRESVSSLIQIQCENICSLRLSDSDMDLVWK